MALLKIVSCQSLVARIPAKTAIAPIEDSLHLSRRSSTVCPQVMQAVLQLRFSAQPHTYCLDLELQRQLLQTRALAEQRKMSSLREQQFTWEKVIQTYEKAQECGATSKYKTNTQILTDQRLSLNFVLRVSESLRDKPKPPKSR